MEGLTENTSDLLLAIYKAVAVSKWDRGLFVVVNLSKKQEIITIALHECVTVIQAVVKSWLIRMQAINGINSWFDMIRKFKITILNKLTG